jgi:hypothetical protein
MKRISNSRTSRLQIRDPNILRMQRRSVIFRVARDDMKNNPVWSSGLEWSVKTFSLVKKLAE